MKNFSRIIAACAIAFAVAFNANGVDSFITDGWPVTDTSVSAYSAASTVQSGQLADESDASAVDGRFRSDLGSVDALAFDTFPPKGFIIIIK
jgi:hypothetical protein